MERPDLQYVVALELSALEKEAGHAIYDEMERLDPEGVEFPNLPSDTQNFYRHAVIAFIEANPSLVQRVLALVELRRRLPHKQAVSQFKKPKH